MHGHMIVKLYVSLVVLVDTEHSLPFIGCFL